MLSSVVQTCPCTFYTCSAISSNLFPYFLHLFNSVPFKIFWKIFIMSSFTPFLLSPGLVLHYNCSQLLYSMLFLQCTYIWYFFFVKQLYIIQQPCQLEWETVSWMPLATEQNADLDPECLELRPGPCSLLPILILIFLIQFHSGTPFQNKSLAPLLFVHLNLNCLTIAYDITILGFT